MVDAVGWSYIIAGKLFQGIIAPYTNVMGDFFWALIILMTMMVIYLKNQNYVTTAVIGMLLSTSIQVVMPTQTYWISYIAILFGVTAVLYKLFR